MGRSIKHRNEGREKTALAFLAEVETPPASSRFREYGAQRAWAEAGTCRSMKARSTGWRARRNPALLYRVVVVILVVTAVLLASTTVAYALSYGAQPDSPLYGTKIFFERARIAITTSGAENIILEMRYSERRMDELNKMVAAGNQKGVDHWLREYGRNIGGAGALFETVPPQDEERLSPQFLELLERHAQMMEGMRNGDPAGLYQRIEDAYMLCDQERVRMRQRCGRQEPVNPTQEPGGRQQHGDCQPTRDQSSQEESLSPAGVEAEDYSSIAEGPDNHSDTTQPNGSLSAGSGQGMGDAGQQGQSPCRGHTP